MLTINDDRFINRAEVIWEKGTNRSEFFRGEVNKYGWVDTGSSFLPSEIIAAFLWAQIENIDVIQDKRKTLWNCYFQNLFQSEFIQLPLIPEYATNNAHMFYLTTKNIDVRNALILRLKENGFHAVFHYISLHSSPYYNEKHDGRSIINADMFTECLVRLPLFFELEENEVLKITECIKAVCAC